MKREKNKKVKMSNPKYFSNIQGGSSASGVEEQMWSNTQGFSGIRYECEISYSKDQEQYTENNCDKQLFHSAQK